jgi:adenosylhomocysteine nucleosidase
MTLRGARNPVTLDRNPVHFPADPRLLKLAQEAARRVALDPLETPDGKRTPQVVTGTVATGDVFVESTARSRELRAEHKADAVEMEGAAVAQVCFQWQVPCLVIRSVSDLANETAGLDSQVFLHLAARNSALLVTEILAALGKGEKAK